MLLGYAVLKTGGVLVQAGAKLTGVPTVPRGTVDVDDEDGEEDEDIPSPRVTLSEEARRMVEDGTRAPVPTADNQPPREVLSGSLTERMARARVGG